MQVWHIPFLHSVIAPIYLLSSRQAVQHKVVDLVHLRIQDSEEGPLDAEVRA
jgi:hypothetical protein